MYDSAGPQQQQAPGTQTILVVDDGVELLTVLDDGTVPAEALVIQAFA